MYNISMAIWHVYIHKHTYVCTVYHIIHAYVYILYHVIPCIYADWNLSLRRPTLAVCQGRFAKSLAAKAGLRHRGFVTLTPLKGTQQTPPLGKD